MNYFTVVPNYMPNMVRMSNPIQFQPQLSLQTRLISLSTALRISILSYQKTFIEPTSQEKAQNTPIASPSVNTNSKQRIIVKFKEQDQQSPLSNVTQKAVVQQKTNPPSFTDIKLSPILSPKSVDQCNAIKIQRVNDAKKSQISKQPKEAPKQAAKDVEATDLPSVDLIDCAYLPALGLSREELAVIRCELENREVEEWKNNQKGRKDRRQLRMLNN